MFVTYANVELKLQDEGLTCSQFFAAGLGDLFLWWLRFGFPLQAAVTFQLSRTPVLNIWSGSSLPEWGGRVLARGTGGLGRTPGRPHPDNQHNIIAHMLWVMFMTYHARMSVCVCVTVLVWPGPCYWTWRMSSELGCLESHPVGHIDKYYSKNTAFIKQLTKHLCSNFTLKYLKNISFKKG